MRQSTLKLWSSHNCIQLQLRMYTHIPEQFKQCWARTSLAPCKLGFGATHALCCCWNRGDIMPYL